MDSSDGALLLVVTREPTAQELYNLLDRY